MVLRPWMSPTIPSCLQTAHKTILLDDWPGAAGPAPGWPLNQGPDAVRQYLANSVRYVVFGYKYADWTSLKACQFFPRVGNYSELDEELEVLSLVALHQFDQLRALHQTIYDDGTIAVIDLPSPATARPVNPDWTLTTSKDGMCSAAIAQSTSTRNQQACRKWRIGKSMKCENDASKYYGPCIRKRRSADGVPGSANCRPTLAPARYCLAP